MEGDIFDNDAPLYEFGTIQYAYDSQNQLVATTFDPDGPGPLDSISTFFSHHDGQVALQFDGSSATDLSHRYLWGAAVDQLLTDEQVTSLSTAGNVVWPLADHLGTIRDLASHNSTTNTTTIDNHRVYDAFGNLISETNSAVDEVFGFTGRMFDESTGFQNNLNRWYDPKAGRWISEDPLGFAAGDTNLYRYVGNNPESYSDPSGLWGWNPLLLWQALGDRIGAGRQARRDLPHNAAINIDAASIREEAAARDFLDPTSNRSPADLAERRLQPIRSLASDIYKIIDGAAAEGELASEAIAIAQCGAGAMSMARGLRRAPSSVPLKRGPKIDPNAPRNATIRIHADLLEAGGNEIIAGGRRLPEKLIPTPGGIKSGRRPDILFRTSNGQLRGRNIGHVDAAGNPVKRELEALGDLNGPGGLPTDFVPF